LKAHHSGTSAGQDFITPSERVAVLFEPRAQAVFGQDGRNTSWKLSSIEHAGHQMSTANQEDRKFIDKQMIQSVL
jgi:hypothetical protein